MNLLPWVGVNEKSVADRKRLRDDGGRAAMMMGIDLHKMKKNKTKDEEENDINGNGSSSSMASAAGKTKDGLEVIALDDSNMSEENKQSEHKRDDDDDNYLNHMNSDDDEDDIETLDLVVSKIKELYTSAVYLRSLNDKGPECIKYAQKAFNSLLSHPILSNLSKMTNIEKIEQEGSKSAASDEPENIYIKILVRIKYSALINLAEILEASEEYNNAFDYLVEATKLDPSDVSIWVKLGQLSLKLAKAFSPDYYLNFARYSFSQGRLHNPNNWLCLEGLCETLVKLQDIPSALSLANDMLILDPQHQFASVVKRDCESALLLSSGSSSLSSSSSSSSPQKLSPAKINMFEHLNSTIKKPALKERLSAGASTIDGEEELQKDEGEADIINLFVKSPQWSALDQVLSSCFENRKKEGNQNPLVVLDYLFTEIQPLPETVPEPKSQVQNVKSEKIEKVEKVEKIEKPKLQPKKPKQSAAPIPIPTPINPEKRSKRYLLDPSKLNSTLDISATQSLTDSEEAHDTILKCLKMIQDILYPDIKDDYNAWKSDSIKNIKFDPFADESLKANESEKEEEVEIQSEYSEDVKKEAVLVREFAEENRGRVMNLSTLMRKAVLKMVEYRREVISKEMKPKISNVLVNLVVRFSEIGDVSEFIPDQSFPLTLLQIGFLTVLNFDSILKKERSAARKMCSLISQKLRNWVERRHLLALFDRTRLNNSSMETENENYESIKNMYRMYCDESRIFWYCFRVEEQKNDSDRLTEYLDKCLDLCNKMAEMENTRPELKKIKPVLPIGEEPSVNAIHHARNNIKAIPKERINDINKRMSSTGNDKAKEEEALKLTELVLKSILKSNRSSILPNAWKKVYDDYAVIRDAQLATDGMKKGPNDDLITIYFNSAHKTQALDQFIKITEAILVQFIAVFHKLLTPDYQSQDESNENDIRKTISVDYIQSLFLHVLGYYISALGEVIYENESDMQKRRLFAQSCSIEFLDFCFGLPEPFLEGSSSTLSRISSSSSSSSTYSFGPTSKLMPNIIEFPVRKHIYQFLIQTTHVKEYQESLLTRIFRICDSLSQPRDEFLLFFFSLFFLHKDMIVPKIQEQEKDSRIVDLIRSILDCLYYLSSDMKLNNSNPLMSMKTEIHDLAINMCNDVIFSKLCGLDVLKKELSFETIKDADASSNDDDGDDDEKDNAIDESNWTLEQKRQKVIREYLSFKFGINFENEYRLKKDNPLETKILFPYLLPYLASLQLCEDEKTLPIMEKTLARFTPDIIEDNPVFWSDKWQESPKDILLKLSTSTFNDEALHEKLESIRSAYLSPSIPDLMHPLNDPGRHVPYFKLRYLHIEEHDVLRLCELDLSKCNPLRIYSWWKFAEYYLNALEKSEVSSAEESSSFQRLMLSLSICSWLSNEESLEVDAGKKKLFAPKLLTVCTPQSKKNTASLLGIVTAYNIADSSLDLTFSSQHLSEMMFCKSVNESAIKENEKNASQAKGKNKFKLLYRCIHQSLHDIVTDAEVLKNANTSVEKVKSILFKSPSTAYYHYMALMMKGMLSIDLTFSKLVTDVDDEKRLGFAYNLFQSAADLFEDNEILPDSPIRTYEDEGIHPVQAHAISLLMMAKIRKKQLLISYRDKQTKKVRFADRLKHFNDQTLREIFKKLSDLKLEESESTKTNKNKVVLGEYIYCIHSWRARLLISKQESDEINAKSLKMLEDDLYQYKFSDGTLPKIVFRDDVPPEFQKSQRSSSSNDVSKLTKILHNSCTALLKAQKISPFHKFCSMFLVAKAEQKYPEIQSFEFVIDEKEGKKSNNNDKEGFSLVLDSVVDELESLLSNESEKKISRRSLKFNLLNQLEKFRFDNIENITTNIGRIYLSLVREFAVDECVKKIKFIRKCIEEIKTQGDASIYSKLVIDLLKTMFWYVRECVGSKPYPSDILRKTQVEVTGFKNLLKDIVLVYDCAHANKGYIPGIEEFELGQVIEYISVYFFPGISQEGLLMQGANSNVKQDKVEACKRFVRNKTKAPLKISHSSSTSSSSTSKNVDEEDGMMEE